MGDQGAWVQKRNSYLAQAELRFRQFGNDDATMVADQIRDNPMVAARMAKQLGGGDVETGFEEPHAQGCDGANSAGSSGGFVAGNRGAGRQ